MKASLHQRLEVAVQFDTGLVMQSMNSKTTPSSALYCWNTWCGLVVSFRRKSSGETLTTYGLADGDHASDDESKAQCKSGDNFRGSNSGEGRFHAFTLRGTSSRELFVHGLRTDSLLGPSAARGLANRKGAGALKHLQVRSLWLQQARVDGQVKVDRVDTLLNTADSGT